MAVVSFGNSDADVFVMKQRFLALLLEKASAHVSSPADTHTLQQAAAFSGLMFETMEPDQAQRLVPVVRTAIQEFRSQLHPSVHPSDKELDVLLQQIAQRLNRPFRTFRSEDSGSRGAGQYPMAGMTSPSVRSTNSRVPRSNW